MHHAPLLAAAALASLCTLGACRNTDQPEKKPSAAPAPPSTSEAKPAPAAQAKPAGTQTTTPPAAKDQPMTKATATPPAIITAKHTYTKPGKALADANKLPANLQEATFGAGCFWGVEDTFRAVPGVIATSVGFSGGKTQAPSYKQVCYEGTGHAEVVDVVFDPATVSYEKLLEVFFANHNPTQVNRQGPDYGDQYRTVIFFHGDAQKAAAEKAKADLAKSGKWQQPIATQVVKFQAFWPAEDYHQTYHEKNGGTCH